MGVKNRLEKLERKHSGQVIYLQYGDGPPPPDDFTGPVLHFICSQDPDRDDWPPSKFCYPAGWKGPRVQPHE